MAIRFQPMRGLTLAVLICLPILIGLGIWQYQRWQWKTGVLAEIEAAVTAEPLQSLAALAALPDDSPVEFRRIQIAGEATGPTWHLYAPEGAIQWQPFRVVVDKDRNALVGFPRFDDRVKDRIAPPKMPDAADREGTRAGYVRRIQPVTGLGRWLNNNHNPDKNRWFAVNPDNAWTGGSDVYIDLHPSETDASALSVLRPDIANNHVSYMLTWWSFAVIMLIIYGMLHRRAGRLSW